MYLKQPLRPPACPHGHGEKRCLYTASSALTCRGEARKCRRFTSRNQHSNKPDRRCHATDDPQEYLTLGPGICEPGIAYCGDCYGCDISRESIVSIMQQIGSPRRFVQLTLNTYTSLSSVAPEWKRCGVDKITGNGNMPNYPVTYGLRQADRRFQREMLAPFMRTRHHQPWRQRWTGDPVLVVQVQPRGQTHPLHIQKARLLPIESPSSTPPRLSRLSSRRGHHNVLFDAVFDLRCKLRAANLKQTRRCAL